MANSITEFGIQSHDIHGVHRRALKTFEELFNNSSYSDITVRLMAPETEFPAHRVFLARHSHPLHNVLMDNPETEVLHVHFANNNASAYSYWRVFQYMYGKSYSVGPVAAPSGIDDEPELLKHSTVAFFARLLRIKGLETLALGLLRSQLQSERPLGELVHWIREMYATRDPEARHLVVTEAAKLYVQLPAFAETLHEAARQVGDFAVDLMKVFTKRSDGQED